MAKKKYKKGTGMAIGLAIGLAMGVGLWLMSDNIVWLAIALPIGFAIGAGSEKNYSKKN